MFAPSENIGIMDEGYFVPRTELIGWINDLLKVRAPSYLATSLKN
jgi:hypothetical protein